MEKVVLVRQVVESLEEDGLIELRRGDWPTQTTRWLPPRQRARLRAEDMPWTQPEATDLFAVITRDQLICVGQGNPEYPNSVQARPLLP